MSYAAKGERVFLYQDPTFPNCTPPTPKRSDHRLKRFQSTLDKRAWHFCQEVRSRHFQEMMSGSRTCLVIGGDCHKYVPLEELIKILMAEKDKLIKELEEQLRICCQGSPGDTGDMAERNKMQSQIAGLTEEVNKSRDMLRAAMHKLQNIDEIVNENKKLQCRLRCSEERVKFLEEKKRHLETELADLRTRSQIQIDLEKAQEMLCLVQQREQTPEADEAQLQVLALERDELQEKVKKLENELEESKKKEAEIEMLKKQSQSDSLDKEEMSRENECYRKKLASMKCLEKQIQELKKQGRALADKYRRESQKAAEQMNKMSQAAKELQSLREERDSLRRKVDELSSYECQYNKLQRKLQRVDAVITENENLNNKLLALQKLEEENEYLKCKLKTIQEVEINAAEDKERIMQLQCAVADQEEEMKDLLCQIEKLTSGAHEEELERLKCELCEKNSKLKLCEEQLAEIPMLEAEIDELRTKLQCCCREFPEKKKGENSCQKLEVRFPATSKEIRVKYKTPGENSSSVIGIRREEKVGLKDKHGRCQEILQTDSKRAYKVTSECSTKKELMSCEEVHSLLQSSKGIISCVLEDMVEHQKEMEELEMCNRAMKEEIETLKAKVGSSDKDCLLEEINSLKRTLEEKDAEISRLRRASTSKNGEDVDTLKELNRQMKVELEAACAGLKQVADLERMFENEHRARCEAESRLLGEGQSKNIVGEVTEEDPEFHCCKVLQRETDDLKLQIEALNKLTDELKKENELLRELQKPCPDFSKELDEKCALENLLSLLQAELDAFKGQKLSDECEALRNELKRVMEQNCQLKALVSCYRQRLDLEKESNQLNQMKLARESERLPDSTGAADIGSELKKSLKGEEEKEKEEEDLKKLEEDAEAGEKAELTGEGITDSGEKEPGFVDSGESRPKDSERSKEPGVIDSSVAFSPSKEISGTKDTERLKKPEMIDSSVAFSPGEGKPGIKDAESLKKPEVMDSSVAFSPGEDKSGIKDTERLKKPEMIDSSVAFSPGEEKPGIKDAGSLKKPEMIDSSVAFSSREEKPGIKDAGSLKKPELTDSAVAFSPSQEKSATKDAETFKKPSPSGKLDTIDEATAASAREGKSAKEYSPDEKTLDSADKAIAGTRDDEKAKMVDSSVEGKPQMRGAATDAEGKSEVKAEALALTEKEKDELAKANAAQQFSTASPGLPDDCEARLKQMEAENAEKLKKLMDQHEKELADREKAYNENLNSMKSGYEADIKKLAERHKQSIMRLQELHEDEVQEMNSNYETQMEMMHTQSEAAIKDVALGSAAKARKMIDQHAKEMQDAEEKFQVALGAKDSEYMSQLDGLREGLTKSQLELEILKKKGQQGAAADVEKLKAQQARELQKTRRASKQKLEGMKKLLEDERRKSESEIESLKMQLSKEQEKGQAVCECKYSKKKPRKPRDPSCPLDFNEVLEKILQEGLDSLTFNEVALVHRKTCCALEGIVMKSNTSTLLELEPPIGNGCPHTPLFEADKQQLLSRIFNLENAILQKQRQTQEAIISMEVAIKKERCRLLEIKTLLQNEQQKNTELKLLLSSQTKLQTDLKKERDKMGSQASMHQSLYQEKTKQLDEEKRNRMCLEAEVEKLRNTLKHLCMTLDVERGTHPDCKSGDQVEVMRSKLEQAIIQERRLALQLENETKSRMQLQCQLQTLRQSLKNVVNLPEVESVSRITQNPLGVKTAKEGRSLDRVNEKGNKMKTKSVKKQKK